MASTNAVDELTLLVDDLAPTLNIDAVGGEMLVVRDGKIQETP